MFVWMVCKWKKINDGIRHLAGVDITLIVITFSVVNEVA